MTFQDSTLNVQRYVLELLCLINGNDSLVNNDKWMTAANECEWLGTFCKVHEGVVDHVDLSNNNLIEPNGIYAVRVRRNKRT